jgi:two-component system, sensor histidine kinase and response regulator
MEKLKILIVDDETGIRSGITRILTNHTVSFPFLDEDYGFECREASSGEEALEMIAADMPNIMLLDNKLPGMDGIEVLKIIQERKLDILVAMITSYASLEVAARATDDGARDFIPKPFTPAELKSSIDLITKQLFLKRITRNMKEEGKKIRYQFLSVLSHELKSPLNALEGYLRMIQDRELGGNLNDYNEILGRCFQRVEGMRLLIMDLMDFTRIRLENREEKIERVDVTERARMALSTIRPLSIQKNIEVRLDATEPVFVNAAPNDVDIILNNLLSNAVKYNRDGGNVVVKVRKDENSAVLTVTDTGIGMNPEDISVLFKEFVRIKNQRTRGITGSGLGLSIVNKITEIYGGKIQVESEPEQGSIFRVILPAG